VDVNVKRVDATIYINGFVEILPRYAPTEAIIMLVAISLFGPNLSDNKPVGTVKSI